MVAWQPCYLGLSPIYKDKALGTRLGCLGHPGASTVASCEPPLKALVTLIGSVEEEGERDRSEGGGGGVGSSATKTLRKPLQTPLNHTGERLRTSTTLWRKDDVLSKPALKFCRLIRVLRDSTYYYCACVLRISRYSGFLWVVPPNTWMFLRSLKLCGESRT